MTDKKKKKYDYDDYMNFLSDKDKAFLQTLPDSQRVYMGKRIASDFTWQPDSVKKKIIPGDPNSVKGKKALGDVRKIGSDFGSSFGSDSSFGDRFMRLKKIKDKPKK